MRPVLLNFLLHLCFQLIHELQLVVFSTLFFSCLCDSLSQHANRTCLSASSGRVIAQQ